MKYVMPVQVGLSATVSKDEKWLSTTTCYQELGVGVHISSFLLEILADENLNLFSALHNLWSDLKAHDCVFS